jgi:hypothetical protein
MRLIVSGPLLDAGRSAFKIPTTVGTDVVKFIFHAICTEGTFVRTDKCFGGIRWQACIAALAMWSEYQHECWILARPDGGVLAIMKVLFIMCKQAPYILFRLRSG